MNYYYFNNIIYNFVDSSVDKVGKTKLVAQQIPLLLYGGEVLLATTGGTLTQLTLSTHDGFTQTLTNQEVADINLTKQLMLHR